jgi:hypothetical protein
MASVSEIWLKGQVFGEPMMGMLVVLRSILPGRPYMVVSMTVLLNLLSAIIVALVFETDHPFSTAETAAQVVMSVSIGLVQYNLTAIMSQGVATGVQMLGIWTDITDTLLNIRSMAVVSTTNATTREQLPTLLCEMLQHATRIVYSKERLILHTIRNDLENDEDDAAAERTLIETKTAMMRQLIKVEKLDFQTMCNYFDNVSSQISALQVLRMSYVPFEYNVAYMSFFTLTFGIFFPMSAFLVFGWWYLVINTIILLHMLSNYDTAVTLGDVFHSQAGSLGSIARDITDTCHNTLASPLPSL